MLDDLAALAPSIIVCVGFAVAVAAFIRHEMRRAGRGTAADASADISPDTMIDGRDQAPSSDTSDGGIAGSGPASSR